MRCIKLLVLLVFLGSQFTAYTQDSKPKTDPPPYSNHVKKEGFDVSFVETERAAKYSVVMIEIKEGGSVGSSMFLMQCASDLARARKFKFFANGKEWDDEDNPGRGYMRIFFTNSGTTPPKELMGEDYSGEAKEIFDELGYTSVAELKTMNKTIEKAQKKFDKDESKK